jgi:hypothetical protein
MKVLVVISAQWATVGTTAHHNATVAQQPKRVMDSLPVQRCTFIIYSGYIPSIGFRSAPRD